MKAPVVIDVDLIRQMRHEGRRIEAERLLAAFRRNCEKQQDQDRAETINLMRRVQSFKKKVIGQCRHCKEKTLPGRVLCQKHAEMQYNYYHNLYLLNKSRILERNKKYTEQKKVAAKAYYLEKKLEGKR